MKSWIALCLLLVALCGCETEGGLLLTYAAQGTEIQAERLVAQFLGTPAKALPYRGLNLDRPLQRMRARWPQIKAALDGGTIGLTETGELALRVASQDSALNTLVRDENHDRGFYYRALSDAVGHGG